MRKFLDWNGNKIAGMIPDTLMVSPDLENTAEEALRTDLKLGTANNDTNLMSKVGFKPKLIVNDFLDDTNDWFAINSKKSKLHLHYVNRESLKLWNDSSSTTLVLQFAGYYRVGFGFSDYRWVVGHQVA